MGRAKAVLPFAVALSASITAAWFVYAQGWTMYFGDAEAHLNISRRLTDNRTPGLDQLGVPWLPLPHLLTAPFAAIDSLWFSGLAGTIPAAVCFAASAMFLFAALAEIFGSRIPAWAGMLAFLLNPNALYLQSTALTEPIFGLWLCAILFFTVRFRRTQSVIDVVCTGIAAACATLTRYEGWFILPFCAIYFLLVAQRRWRAAATFCGIAGLAPASWVFYNWWLSGNWIEFLNGPGSAKAIQGGRPYPGKNDPGLAWLYWKTCIRLVLGPVLFWMIPIGGMAALIRRKWWPLILLALPTLFYLWSIESTGSTPIFMPELWPHSWYNDRYGVVALPLAAFGAAALAGIRKPIGAVVVVILAILPWVRHPSPENWIAWKESQVNSVSRRAWIGAAARYMQAKVRGKETIMADFDDTIGIFRYARIPLRQVFHSGNTLIWEAAIQRPDSFLSAGWVVCQRRADSRLCRVMPGVSRYHLEHSVRVPGAEPIDIFKHNDGPLHQGARRQE